MPGYLQEEESKNGNGRMQQEDGPPKIGRTYSKITVPILMKMKADGVPIVALTAYDYTMAAQLEYAGVDVVLVGDSLGCVVQGHSGTLPVQLDHILYHTRFVSRALNRALLIADLPFSSMHSVESVVQASVRILAEAGAAMVKLEISPEGGEFHLEMIRALRQRSIPVCAHLGLTPQSVHSIGGYRVQGKEKAARSAEQLLEQSMAAERAGASLLVLECVPAKLAQQISKSIKIPTIGIGASVECDGQILVLHDMLGLQCGEKAPPKFVKNFLQGNGSIQAALAAYVLDVRQRKFPAPEHSYI